jgi:hypothetical protein
MGDVANRDEAFKCLDIATAALQAGDPARAERFAGKALRLYRCSKVSGEGGCANPRGLCVCRTRMPARVTQY